MLLTGTPLTGTPLTASPSTVVIAHFGAATENVAYIKPCFTSSDEELVTLGIGTKMKKTPQWNFDLAKVTNFSNIWSRVRCALPLWETSGVTAYDVISGLNYGQLDLSAPVSFTWPQMPYGTSWQSTIADGIGIAPPTPVLDGSQDFTILLFGQYQTGGVLITASPDAQWDAGSWGNGWSIVDAGILGGTPGTLAFVSGEDFVWFQFGTYSYASSTDNLLEFSWNAESGSMSLSVNGVFNSSGSLGFAGAFNGGLCGLGNGFTSDGSTVGIIGNYAWFIGMDGILSPDQRATIAANPHAIWYPVYGAATDFLAEEKKTLVIDIKAIAMDGLATIVTSDQSGNYEALLSYGGLPRIVKPKPWAFDPKKVDGKWAPLWQQAAIGLPLWEATGESLLDVVSGNHLTQGSPFPDPTPWVGDDFGIALNTNAGRGTGSNQGFNVPGNVLSGANDFTLLILGRYFSQVIGNFATYVQTEDTDGWALLIPTGGLTSQLISLVGFSAPSTPNNWDLFTNWNTTPVADGKIHLIEVQYIKATKTVSLYLDSDFKQSSVLTSPISTSTTGLKFFLNRTPGWLSGPGGNSGYFIGLNGSIDANMRAQIKNDLMGMWYPAAGIASEAYDDSLIGVETSDLTISTENFMSIGISQSVANTEASANIDVNLKDNAESGIQLVRDLTANTDAEIAVLIDLAPGDESLQSLRSDALAQVENAQNLAKDSIAQREATGAFSADSSAPNELLSAFLSDLSSDLELIVTVRTDAPSQSEYGTGLTTTLRAQQEIIAQISVDLIANEEFKLQVDSQQVSQDEVLRAVQRDFMAPVEYSVGIIAQAIAQIEWSTHLRFDVPTNIETTTQLLKDVGLNIEVLNVVLLEQDVQFEIQNTIQVINLFGLPIEWSGTYYFRASLGYVALAKPLNRIARPDVTVRVALAPSVKRVAIMRNLPMPQAINDLSPIDPESARTIVWDFGPMLADGSTITNILSTWAIKHSGNDPEPNSRLVGTPEQGTAPIVEGGSGVINAAILQQVQNMVPGTTLSFACQVRLSNGDTPINWVRMACKAIT